MKKVEIVSCLDFFINNSFSINDICYTKKNIQKMEVHNVKIFKSTI